MALELFVFQGSMLAGVGGAVLMLVAIAMGMADMFPGTPRLPTLPQLRLPLRGLGVAMIGTVFIGLRTRPLAEIKNRFRFRRFGIWHAV